MHYEYKEGDRVAIMQTGPGGPRVMSSDVIYKVRANGNFTLSGDRKRQFRQSGYRAGGDIWGRTYIEPWTEEHADLYRRQRLELRARNLLNSFQTSDASDETLSALIHLIGVQTAD